MLAGPLEAARPGSRAEMAHAPPGKNVWVGLRIAHAVGPVLVADIDCDVSIDIRSICDDQRRPANGPARRGLGLFDNVEVAEALLDGAQRNGSPKQDRQALRVEALVRHRQSPACSDRMCAAWHASMARRRRVANPAASERSNW